MKKVLVVDDEKNILILLKDTLGKSDFDVFLAQDLDYAKKILEEENIDCIVLDVEIGKDNGINFCKELRTNEKTKDISIIIITAKFINSEDVVKGLDFGADDYIIKPFKINILIARINAIFRRKKSFVGTNLDKRDYKLGYFNIKYSEFKIYLHGRDLKLTKKEFQILSFLIEREGFVIEKHVLISEIWGKEYFVNDKTIGKHVENIRNKLNMFSICLETINGIGYKFVLKI